MSSGLVALFDDIAAIARLAAASLDDVGLGVAKAGAQAAGVVIDDAAVTPAYVTGFTPDRELPIIWKITKGSLRNKLVILLPIAILLSQFLPWAITPLLMLGGLYLSFEGAEKLIEKLGGRAHGETIEGPVGDPAAFEQSRVAGAVRTDFILSAEIMAIALAQVEDEPLLERIAVLGIVAVAITLAVYGTVGLIVKMDDIGLHLARRRSNAARAVGAFLLRLMPRLLGFLAGLGTLAMLWVGGGILLHGGAELGLHAPADAAHAVQRALAAAAGPAGGAAGWLGYAVCSAIAGLVAGAAAVAVVHLIGRVRGKAAGHDPAD